jgi:GNAT superfamily N-acetyltransferase
VGSSVAEVICGEQREVLIRSCTPEEWRRLRALRYVAMEEAPYAAIETLSRERALADEVWQERARPSAREVWLVAEAANELVATALAVFEEADETAYLGGMWVEPKLRGRGIGRALVNAAFDWAKQRGARRIKLEVSSANESAVRLFEETGFSRTGATRPLASERRASAVEMERLF